MGCVMRADSVMDSTQYASLMSFCHTIWYAPSTDEPLTAQLAAVPAAKASSVAMMSVLAGRERSVTMRIVVVDAVSCGLAITAPVATWKQCTSPLLRDLMVVMISIRSATSTW